MYALGGIGYCGQHLPILQYKVLLHVLMCTVEEGLGQGEKRRGLLNVLVFASTQIQNNVNSVNIN